MHGFDLVAVDPVHEVLIEAALYDGGRHHQRIFVEGCLNFYRHQQARPELLAGVVEFGLGADGAGVGVEIDRDGFDQWDKRIIETLIYKFNGGPVGLSSLAVAVGEEAGTLEEVNEPYLIMEGYLKRTAQGRVALPNAYRKLGLKVPANSQTDLFAG